MAVRALIKRSSLLMLIATTTWDLVFGMTLPTSLKTATSLHATGKTNVAHDPSWVCPAGFEEGPKNLQGKSGVKFEESNDTSSCARSCCKRDGCTSFEYGTSTKYKGCWTYTDGDADIKFADQLVDWISCLKKDDPGACNAYACPPGYDHLVKNLQGSSGLKTEFFDAENCSQSCCSRPGCTSFEFGPNTKYKGCWTYADGDADIKFKDQIANWTSCVRTTAPDCPTTTTTTTTTEKIWGRPCPDGYETAQGNIDGSSGQKASSHMIAECEADPNCELDETHCGLYCCMMAGCTSFEFGNTTKYAGCWTYYGGEEVVPKPEPVGWAGCIKTSASCPATTTQVPAIAPASGSPQVPESPVKAPSASGDPHLINTRGERFDIFKTGQMEFLRVPYESAATDANFTVLATIQGVAESMTQCNSNLYITSLVLGGAWLQGWPLEITMLNGQMTVRRAGSEVKPSRETRHVGNMVQLDMQDANQLHVGVGGSWIDVSRDLQPVHYFLNMQARSLGLLASKVGGLLGEDDHTEVSTPPPGCKFASLKAREHTAQLPQASARMTA